MSRKFLLRPAGWRSALAVVSVGVALAATHSQTNPVFPTPLFFAAIVLSTWYAGSAAGLLAVVLATLALDYYFIPPTRSFTLTKPELPYLLQFAFPALLTIWFVRKRRITETALRESRDELESRVQERTAELRAQIAERIRAEETVQKAQAELAHVTRAVTVGELGVSIAHEVNQPLMAVMVNGDACLRWLEAEPPNLQEARQAVVRMIEEGNRAGTIVRRIRALSKKTPPDRVPVDLNELIQEVVRLIQRETIRRQVSIHLELTASLPAVLGDRVQLAQVILNLAINAIEGFDQDVAGPRELSIRSTVADNRSVTITVEDNGPGLPPGDPEQIFTAFFTTKAQGLGMGLPISKTIVEAHGGSLAAASGDGGGARFEFHLPVEQGS